MAVKWTKEQRQVIDLHDRNILVSAAAGSGKTAVLVERIISRITDEKNPVDVDKLLVVTYTEAAAAEMKERIAAAIEKKLEEFPGNLNLEQQASLIHSAMITTVHKFCLSVIRDHFHVIGIDPSFRVGEEGELRLLKQDVLDEMLEEHYAKDEEEFREFVEKYGTGRTDKKIEELILQLYEYSRSYPDPRQWLISCAEDYEIDREHLEDSRMVHTVEERVRQQLGDLYGLVRQAMEICQLPAGPYMYAEALESDEKELKKLGFSFEDSKSNFIFATHKSVPAGKIFQALRERHIYVRYFEKPRIDNYLRITIGTREEMQTLFDFLKDYLTESSK